MNITQPLRVARAERNLSQKQLAYCVNVSRVTICHIENGIVRPKKSTKEKIEEFLGPVDWERTYDEGLVQRQTVTN